jgi:hypothetical protein
MENRWRSKRALRLPGSSGQIRRRASHQALDLCRAALVSGSLLVAGCGTQQLGPAQTDVCRNQAREFAQRELNAKPVHVGLTWANTAGTGDGQVWLRTDRCDGELVIRLNAIAPTCSAPHYGRVPNYLGPVLAVTGDCTMP